MDVLNYKLIDADEGSTYVLSGINRAQIIKVCRQGIQHDYVSFAFLGASNRSWSFINFGKRVIFRTDTPFGADEKIFIIYKVTT